MKLDVVVTDKSGKPVPGLGLSDFTLFDNSQPSKILSFHSSEPVAANPDPPAEVILVLDALDIPANLEHKEHVAVEAFLRENGGHLSHPTSVFVLTDIALWSVGRTSVDGGHLAADLAHSHELAMLRHIHGGSRGISSDRSGFEEPASFVALKALADVATAARRRPGRKLLLWVGPGWGVGSGANDDKTGSTTKQQVFYTITWFSTLLREARIALYSFSLAEVVTDPHRLAYLDYLPGVQSPEHGSFTYLHRKVLAVQTGGRALDPDEDLLRQIERCVQDATAFYTLSFDPSRARSPDEFHTLEVRVSNPQLTARAATGYYDQPYYTDLPNPAVKRISVAQ